MGFPAELVDLCADTVTIAAAATPKNRYGEDTYGSAVSYAAYVIGKVRMVRDAMGNERVSTVTVVLTSAPTVLPDAKITLPSRFSPQTPPILAVESVPDELGPCYTAVYC